MTYRFCIDIAGIARLVDLSLVFHIRVRAVPEGPAVPVGVALAVSVDFGAVRVEEAGFWELAESFCQGRLAALVVFGHCVGKDEAEA